MSDNSTSHTNNFLKNLSQKKYAWMEEAISSIPAQTPLPDQEPRSKPKTKKQKLSPEPKQQQHKRTHSPTVNKLDVAHVPASSTSAPTTTSSNEMTEEPVKKRKQPLFKYTTFPIKGYNILPTRNISSSYAKNDVSYFRGFKAGSEALTPNPADEWRDTIVIHPGSRNLRIGFASDAFPISVPHVIARKYTKSAIEKTENDDEYEEPFDQERYEDALKEIQGELKWRMKNAKRKAVSNAEQQVVGFNANAFKETILDHNDPYKVEWTDVTKGMDYVVGEKALNTPISKDSEYHISYPWKYGTLNNQDYNSIQHVLSDIEAIWTDTIVNELKVERISFQDCPVVLVIPDLFDHAYLCDLVSMLLIHMDFKSVLVQQESACATYGAGASSAVVVDIGAQKTSICCIEDGVCQTDSRMTIRLGGDDITRTFASFLVANKFPYTDLDLSTTYDWRLAESLKEKWCTLNEADISVQVYDFFARTPFKPTLKYQCKVYDEVFLAPLCLMYPDVLEPKNKKLKWVNKNVTDDAFEDSNTANGGTEVSKSYQEFDSYPIDIAIAQSIETASNGSEEKLRRYFSSIILVGGGGKVANFSKVLEDRVLSTMIAQKSRIDRVEVLPAPRELDSEVIVWKGATVIAKLDCAKDMWIGNEEWEEMGSRCLRERALLM